MYPYIWKPVLFYRTFFFFWFHHTGEFPNQELNSHLLHWKHRVLTTGPLGKSLYFFLKFVVRTEKVNVTLFN